MMPRYKEGFSTEPVRTLYRQTILPDWFFREMLVLFLRSMECSLNIFSPISQKNLKQAAHIYGAAFALGGICESKHQSNFRAEVACAVANLFLSYYRLAFRDYRSPGRNFAQKRYKSLWLNPVFSIATKAPRHEEPQRTARDNYI